MYWLLIVVRKMLSKFVFICGVRASFALKKGTPSRHKTRKYAMFYTK